MARPRLRRRHGVLSRSAERRADARRVIPSARAVIVTATKYNTARPYSTECADSEQAQIARYAWGDDYHEVLAGRHDALIAWMRDQVHEPFEARAYVDTGPVQERVYARHAGIGWIGKNCCVISDALGSWIFLGVIISSLAAGLRLAGARSVRHLHAVPRGMSDAGDRGPRRPGLESVCVVSDDRTPRRATGDLSSAIGAHVYGCDVCQEVCPWNAVAPASSDPAWQPRPVWDQRSLRDLEALSPDGCSRHFAAAR